MLFTVPQDALLAFALGEGLALSASLSITPESRLWGRPFQEALVYLGAVFVPVAYSFFHFWPDWSFLYMIDTTTASAALPLLTFGGVFAAGGLGFALAHALLRRGARQGVVVTLTLVVAGALSSIPLFFEQIWQLGTFDELLVGEARPLTSGPFLLHLAAATLVCALGFVLFVALERRAARRDVARAARPGKGT